MWVDKKQISKKKNLNQWTIWLVSKTCHAEASKSRKRTSDSCPDSNV